MADENKAVPQKAPFAVATEMLRDNGYTFVGAFTGAGSPIFEFKLPSSGQTLGIRKASDGVVMIPDFANKKEAISSGGSIIGISVVPQPDSSFKDEFVRIMADRRLPLPNETAVAEAPAKKKAIVQ